MFSQVVQSVRSGFAAGTTRRVEWRLSQIEAVRRLIEENKDKLASALRADLGMNEFLIHSVELDSILVPISGMLKHHVHFLQIECKIAIASLKEWMKPEPVATPLLNQPAKSSIVREPFGVALIIAPWNYPVSLLLNPLVAALAAGNAAVLKPSEVSVNTSKAMAELIPRYLDPVCVRVVEGAVEETTALLKERFDVIMYTGNTLVGKIVMKAAAEHLTPVLLELGGKCPAIVDRSADLSKTAKRVLWGKFSLNNGQTCVAPDYILTTPEMEPKLIAELKSTLKEFYGENPKESKDISRMINERHTKRVADLLDDKSIEVVTGGQVDVSQRYIAPTIVRCKENAKLMKDEIFGPVLPVLTVPSLQEAIDFVNKREKPLALYVFAEDGKAQQQTLASTSSGGACVNDVAMHVANSNLPFGGVGPSGMGAYHGKHGFEAFSHKKAVFVKHGTDPSLRFPPYTEKKLAWLRRLRSLNLDAVRKPLLLAAVAVLFAVVWRARGH